MQSIATMVMLSELVDYTVRHLEEHRKLIAKVTAFKDKFDSGKAAIGVELMGFLRDWLINHILKVNKSLAGYLGNLSQK